MNPAVGYNNVETVTGNTYPQGLIDETRVRTEMLAAMKVASNRDEPLGLFDGWMEAGNRMFDSVAHFMKRLGYLGYDEENHHQCLRENGFLSHLVMGLRLRVNQEIDADELKWVWAPGKEDK